MSRTAQNFIYFAIIAITAVVLFLTSPAKDMSVHGVFLPATSQVFQSVPADTVQVLSSMPTEAKVIGQVRTAQHFTTTDTKAIHVLQYEAINYARAKAAQHGATALVINTLARTMKSGPLDAVILYGEAIR